jgi:hypothetical protein
MNSIQIRVDSGEGHRQPAPLVCNVKVVKPGAYVAITALHKMRNSKKTSRKPADPANCMLWAVNILRSMM